MGENGNGPEVKPEEKKDQPAPAELTPENIVNLNGNLRATLCVAEVIDVLKKYNCTYNPVLKLDNNGHHIDVNIIGLAYEYIPTAINPLMFNA